MGPRERNVLLFALIQSRVFGSWVALAQQLSRIFYPSPESNEEGTPSEGSASEVFTDEDIVDEGDDMIDMRDCARDSDEDKGR